MNISDLQKLTDWLIDGARSAANSPRMMAETCERMVQAGLPLWRVGVFIQTLHPDIFGRISSGGWAKRSRWARSISTCWIRRDS
jgi:hypothetical protein